MTNMRINNVTSTTNAPRKKNKGVFDFSQEDCEFSEVDIEIASYMTRGMASSDLYLYTENELIA